MRRHSVRPVVAALAGLAAVAGLAGCASSSGGGGASAPASPAPSAVAFTLTSPAFENGAPIPARFTCDDVDVAPPLAWQDAPAGTAAFVLLVTDPDAGGFVHWVAGPLPGSTRVLDDATAHGVPQGVNGFGSIGWRGPCPPSGTHQYVFALGALPAGVAVAAPPTAEGVRAALAHALATATLIGRYGRR